MRALAIAFVFSAAACGHWGFERFDPDAGPGAAVGDAMPDAPPPVLPCSPSQRIAIDSVLAADTKYVSAVATPHGYDVFLVDGAGRIHGFTYDLADGKLGANLTDIQIPGDAYGPPGPVTVGDNLLMATPYGATGLNGTALVPLDQQLGVMSTPPRLDGWFGAGGSLARTTDNKLAFMAQQLVPDGEVDLELVSPTGGSVRGPTKVIDSSDGPVLPTIVEAGARFMVVWGARLTLPTDPPTFHREIHAELVDGALGVGAFKLVSAEQNFDAFNPRAAYLASADRYLVAWTEKISGDSIWVGLRDGNLGAIPGRPPAMVSASGVFPVVIAGDDDFLVVWQDGPGPILDAARVSKDGELLHRGVPSTGGIAVGWELVTRYGQPALVWLERGGTGENLWVDPLCN